MPDRDGLPGVRRDNGCSDDPAARTEQLRAQIDHITAWLGEMERQLEDLRITRETVLALADELAEPPMLPTDLPDNPAYPQILAAFANARQPLRTRDRCQVLDLGFEPASSGADGISFPVVSVPVACSSCSPELARR